MKAKKIQWFPLLVAVALSLSVLTGCGKKTAEEPEAEAKGNGLLIGYASEGVIALDENSLQSAVDKAFSEANDPDHMITLNYQNNAYSSNGIDFQCYIGNANTVDMFVAIYGDRDFTDELYVSQLLRPGTAFESITLNHELPIGQNEVYCAFTKVKEVDGEQVITGQRIVTLQFFVSEPN